MAYVRNIDADLIDPLSLETEMSSSTSSSSSSTKSNRKQFAVNPFEETNKLRLEKSILSPNLFHVTTTSTPERDINNLWNIDQKAILFPVDIPTDDKSLIAQCTHDHKLNYQVNAAVEAFWTQNKIIIESPASSVAAFKTKLNKKSSCLSNYNSPYDYQQQQQNSTSDKTTLFVHQNAYVSSLKKDQMCQTLLSLPYNFDLTKVHDLKAYTHESSPSKELNNSIRKKLFDQTDDTSQATTINTHCALPIITALDRQALTSPTISMASSQWTSESLTHENYHQDHLSSSPKHKFDSNSTPELSPFCEKTPHHTREQHFYFSPSISHQANNEHQHNQHHFGDLILSSPNLSPIKEDNTLKIKEDEQQHECSRQFQTKSCDIEMDMDACSLLKTPNHIGVIKSSSKQIKFEPIGYDLDGVTNMSVSYSNDTFKTASQQYTNQLQQQQLFKQNKSTKSNMMMTFDCIENTTNQESGYQTGGSTQCNLMDITNDFNKVSSLASNKFIYSQENFQASNTSNNNNNNNTKNLLPQSHSIDGSKESQHKNEQAIDLYKTQASHSLPSLTSLYPLGSSTPETSKHYFELDNSYDIKQLLSINYDVVVANRCHDAYLNDHENLSLLKTCDYLNKISMNCDRLDHDFENVYDDYDNDEGIVSRCEGDVLTKSCHMERVILNHKKSASDYARSIIDKAIKDLDDSKNIKLYELYNHS